MHSRWFVATTALSLWLALPALTAGSSTGRGEARITESPGPLQASATALAATSDRLLLGLADGGVAWMDLKTRKGVAIRLPEPAAPTDAVRVEGDRILWRSGGTTYAFDPAERSLTQSDAWPATPAAAERTASAIVLPDGRAVSTLYKADFPGGVGPVTVVGEQVWWGTRDMVFHSDLLTGESEVYLPWNGARGTVRAIVADACGAWVATAGSGVRRLAVDTGAFDGYLRARLGTDHESPPDEASARIAQEMTDWFGTPYRYGGQDKTGCDCSGFVGQVMRCAGIALPRTSGAIARAGVGVRDDLRWGDILCFPGHVALYVGNGRTVEAFNEKRPLGSGSVWHRSATAVRRFLP